MMITTRDSTEEVAKKMKKMVEPAFISYAKATDASSMSVEGLHKHMKTTNKTFDIMAIKSKALAFTMGALKAVASMGINLLSTIVSNATFTIASTPCHIHFRFPNASCYCVIFVIFASCFTVNYTISQQIISNKIIYHLIVVKHK